MILKKLFGKVKIDNKVFEKVVGDEKVESPGMKYRHYAPNTKCKLIYSKDENKQIEIINKFIDKKENIIVLCFKEHKEKILIDDKNKISIGSKEHYEEIAQKIYASLREADSKNADLIIIEGVEKKDLGIAIMNRLIRTCEYDFIDV